jgi:glycosyltransferase involved in cell wall biosynthesis
MGSPTDSGAELTIALLPAGDTFEEFYDKVGVSLDDFRHQQSGGWLFNMIEALRCDGIMTVLIFSSKRVATTTRFVHEPSGTKVCVLPVSWFYVRLRNFARRNDVPLWSSIASYFALSGFRLTRELRRYRCSGILCQEYEDPRFDLSVFLGRLTRRPVFATFQGGVERPSGPERLIRRLTVRGCSGLLIGASVEIDRVRKRYGVRSHMLAQVPNAVDTDLWSPGDGMSIRSELGVSSRAIVIAWHGRVQVERKGLDVLLEAWRVLRRRLHESEINLLLIGWGRDGALLKEMIAELSAPHEVVWVDRYVHAAEELVAYLRAADIYCLPSRHEGFPVAALEAMASALPVVATDVPGTRDLFGFDGTPRGVVVRPDDAVGLCDALAHLAESPTEARLLGAAARERAEQEFSIPIVGQRLSRYLRARGLRG